MINKFAALLLLLAIQLTGCLTIVHFQRNMDAFIGVNLKTMR